MFCEFLMSQLHNTQSPHDKTINQMPKSKKIKKNMERGKMRTKNKTTKIKVEKKDKTFGLGDHVEGLKVARRRSKSPLSQGRHDGFDNSSAELPPPALVLSDGWDERAPTFEA
jgi:hypothetical protein